MSHTPQLPPDDFKRELTMTNKHDSPGLVSGSVKPCLAQKCAAYTARLLEDLYRECSEKEIIHGIGHYKFQQM